MNSKYRMFKNFMFNDLGITKEDIKEWTKEAVREVAKEHVDHHINEWDLKRTFADYRNTLADNMARDVIAAIIKENKYELILSKKSDEKKE